MAWTFIANRGTATTKTGGTTLGVAPTATIAGGRILIVRCVSDDTTGSGPTHAVTDTAGNTYESLVFSSGSSDAAATTVSIHISRLTTQLTTGSTVTLTLGATRATKVIELTEFSAASGFTYALGGSNSAGGSGTTPSVTISGLSSIARLWVGLVGAEGLSGDTFTEDADYVQTITAGTTGSPTASNIKASGGHRIATQTGDTYNPTITSRDWRTCLVAITETAIPAAEFVADVSGTATQASALTTSITAAASVSASATVGTADLIDSGTLSLFVASINAQANLTAFLTLPAEEIYGSMTNYLEDQIIKHMFRTGSFTKPSALYISLHTAETSEAGGGAEVSGGSYARVQLDPGDANWAAVGESGTNALTSNSVQITFPAPTANWGQVTHAAIWDAATSGNMLYFCPLTQPVTISSGAAAPKVTPGGLQINIDVPPLTGFIPLAANVTATATVEGNIGLVYFSDTFESGSLSNWTGLSSTPPTISTAIVKAGTYSMEGHYQIAAGGAANQDSNVYAVKILPAPISHFFMRAYVYFKTPEIGVDTFAGVNRKLFWWSDSSTAGTSQVDYANFLTVWNGSGGSLDTVNLYLSHSGNSIGGGVGTITTVYNLTTFQWNTWHCFEAEVQLNTAGNVNGILRIWKDGTQVYSSTSYNFRGTAGDAQYFSVGRQTNRVNSQQMNEKRYWDGVVIASSYIGL